MSFFFSPLPRRHYRLIVIDVPWHFEVRDDETGGERSPQAHYQTMSDAQILGLPVGELAAPDCLIAMWATSPHLPLALRCLEAWGFKYGGAFPWLKTHASGEPARGLGYIGRHCSEPVVIGYRGRLKACLAAPLDGLIDGRDMAPVIEARRREHSRKPDEFYDWILPNTAVPRVDIFARQARPGFDVWGDQAGKFDEGNGR
ncbi:MT-A70 family methyltransferase [Maricaulis sp.]|uniref:MT-A70 family methyltransferase n=1 Tax=Maricaulis sp. TaxID=1486257 RepID=UPI003A8CA405